MRKGVASSIDGFIEYPESSRAMYRPVELSRTATHSEAYAP
jgi:hypothetical protein